MQNTPESRMNRTTAHPKGRSIEEQHAARAMLAANNLTETQAQVMWAFCSKLVEAARGAEHDAWMILQETQNPHVKAEYVRDFQAGLTRDLGEVRGQLQAIGKLMREGIDGLKAAEGRAA